MKSKRVSQWFLVALAATSASSARASSGEGADSASATRDREESSVRLGTGIHLNALGPSGYEYASGGFATDASRNLELMLEVGYGTANSSASDVGVDVKGKRTTAMLAPRARLRFGDRHAFVLDGTLGFVRHEVSMDATDFTGTFSYTKSGATPFAAAGAGYGFRGDGPFRLAVMLGVSSALSALPTGGASGTMSATTIESLRVVCEDGFAPLGKAHAYGELSFGWMF